MHRVALVLVLVGCGKGDGGDAKAPPAPKPMPPAPSYADVKGVVVTASDVLFDGKSIGVLPERLVTDRAVLVAAIQQTHAPLALSYTEDAPARIVLAALRAIDETAPIPPPPAEDPPDDGKIASGGTGTAMALDEGKMGKHKPLPDAPPIHLRALVAGKPQDLCVTHLPLLEINPERVDLSVRLGVKQWVLRASRINEVERIDSLAKLATSLAERKASAFFQDRQDIDVAAEAGVTGADLTPTLKSICAAGFTELDPLSPDELVAKLGLNDKHNSMTFSVGQPNVQGDYDKAMLRRYIRRTTTKLQDCYLHELETKPSLAGTVTAKFEVKPDGKVSKSDASGVDPAVAKCVAGVISEIEFPRTSGGALTVSYPITFAYAAPP